VAQKGRTYRTALYPGAVATSPADTEVPYALQEAAVQVCGTAFYFKPPLHKLFAHAGVPSALIRKYQHERKFVMARNVFTELDNFGGAGVEVQRRLIRELVRITPQDPDRREEAQRALRELKELATAEGLLEDEKRRDQEIAEKRLRETERRQVHASREKGLRELRDEFMSMLASGGTQDRGYGLEDLLCRLFRLHDVPFEPSYRKGTIDQTDGFFTFESFKYLVEARWRVAQPTATELGGFASKVERRMKSTRGLFVSVAGFREEAVGEVSSSSSLILMDGQDLMLILEGHVSLVQALRLKIDKASREGIIFCPLARID
jgi:Restriction endonuclease